MKYVIPLVLTFCFGQVFSQRVDVGTTGQPSTLKITHPTDSAAIIWDNGDAQILGAQDAFIWNRAKLRFLLDADNNNGVTSQFSLFSDVSIGDNESAPVNFDLNGGQSWINSGNFGIGTNNPTADIEVLGPNNTNAIRWDSGGTILRHHFDMLSTQRGWMRFLLDSDNDDENSHFALYTNKSASSGIAEVRFHLDGNPSWIGPGNFGLGTNSPEEKLDVNGAVKIGNTTNSSPQAGTVRWNPVAKDFEGFTGTAWKSLTSGCSSSGSSNTSPPVPPMCCEQQFLGSNGSAGDNFGRSVDIDGNWAIIGAPDAQTNNGRIYFFEYNGTEWFEHSSFDGTTGDGLGVSVAISGDKAIAGQLFGNQAITYRRISNTWFATDTLSQSLDGFGRVVDISNEHIAIGAPFNGISSGGRVRTYSFASNVWTAGPILVSSNSQIDDDFGIAIAFDDPYLVVGAPGISESYVFMRNGGIWGEQEVLTPSNNPPLNIFGAGVSIDGDYLVVGDPSTDQAYIFKRTGSDWNEVDILIPSQSSNSYGSFISIAGDYILIADEISNGIEGQVYVYHFDGTIWIEIEILTDPIGQFGDQYGVDVATDGANRVIGAWMADPNGSIDQGKVIFGPID